MRRTRVAHQGSETVNLMAVLSGVQRSSQSSAFRGGEVFAFLGGCDLDLRQASMPPGGEAVIECFAMMGGVSVSTRLPGESASQARKRERAEKKAARLAHHENRQLPGK